MKLSVSIIKKVWIVRVINAVLFLSLSTAIYGQQDEIDICNFQIPDQPEDPYVDDNIFKTTITYKQSVKLEDFMRFRYISMGLKANTDGGKVEIRVYDARTYNYDQKRDNPSFLLGFYSLFEDDDAVYVQKSWEMEDTRAVCIGFDINDNCFDYEDRLITVSSNEPGAIKKRIFRAYDNIHLIDHADKLPGFTELTSGGELEVVVEIDYNLPRDFFTDFEFDLRLPGITLNETDARQDVDNDGIHDIADQCNNTPPFYANNGHIEQNSNSRRYGCAIVPKHVEGCFGLKAGDYVGTRNGESKILISVDRSTFFAAKEAQFKSYDAKYYDAVVNGNYDEVIDDLVDLINGEVPRAQNIPYLSDFLEELNPDSFLFSHVEDTTMDVGDIELEYIKFDPDNVTDEVELEFFIDGNTEAVGLRLKQRGFIFAFSLVGVIGELEAIVLGNLPNGKLFLVKDLDDIVDVLAQDIEADAIELLGDSVNEFNVGGIGADAESFNLGITEETPIPFLKECDEEDNLCLGSRMDIEAFDGNPLEQEDSPLPTIQVLRSENYLYKYSTPGYYGFYDLQELVKMRRELIFSAFLTSLAVLGPFTLVTEYIFWLESQELAELAEASYDAYAEEASTIAELSNGEVGQAKIALDESEQVLNSVLNSQNATEEEIFEAQNQYAEARQAHLDAINDNDNNILDRDNLSELSERFKDENEEYSHIIENIDEIDPDGEVRSKTKWLQRIGCVENCEYQCCLFRTDKPKKHWVTRVGMALGAISTGVQFGITNNAYKALKGKKIQSTNAVLSRNFPSISFLGGGEFRITENMIPETIVPTLDNLLNGEHFTFEATQELLTNVYDQPRLDPNSSDVLSYIIESLDEDDKPYIDFSGIEAYKRPIRDLPSAGLIELKNLLQKWDKTHCPSYHTEFKDGSFRLLRRNKTYLTTPDHRRDKCNYRRFRAPNKTSDVIISSETDGIGQRALVSNFGNLIVEDATDCTVWDIFSQELDRQLPDFANVTLGNFLQEKYRKRYLIQSNVTVSNDDDFVSTLKAGEGFVTDDITKGTFVLMRNGKSVLLHQGEDTFILNLEDSVEERTLQQSVDGFEETVLTVPYPILVPTWEIEQQHLASTKELVLDDSTGDLIIKKCGSETISTIHKDAVDVVFTQSFQTNYGDLFVGLDSNSGYDIPDEDDDDDDEDDDNSDDDEDEEDEERSRRTMQQASGTSDAEETTTSAPTDLVLFAGSGIGDSEKVGLPIYTYTKATNELMNPFPLFDINPDDGKSLITSSEIGLPLIDFFISKDGLALVRYIDGLGVFLFTRQSKDNRSQWDSQQLIALDEMAQNNTITKILLAIDPDLYDLKMGDKYELLGDGTLRLFETTSLPYTTNEVASNQYIGSLFNDENIANSEADATLSFVADYLMSEDGSCIATASGDKIKIYSKNTIGHFIFDDQPEHTVSLGLNQTTNVIDSYFFVDERGGLKLMGGSENIVFESANSLKGTAKESYDGVPFKLRLQNNCNLVVVKSVPNFDVAQATYNGDSTSDDFKSYDNLWFFDVDVSLDNTNFALFTHDLPHHNPDVEHGPTTFSEVDYLTLSDDDENLYCRATVFKGEFYLEDTVSGKVLWHFNPTPPLPEFEEKAVGDQNRYRLVQLDEVNSNTNKNGGFAIVDHISTGSGGLGEDIPLYIKLPLHDHVQSQSLKIVKVEDAANNPSCAIQLIQEVMNTQGFNETVTLWDSNSEEYWVGEYPTMNVNRIGTDLSSQALSSLNSSIEIFPNPVENGVLSILSKKETIWKIGVIALNGNLVKTIDKKINKNKRIKIDIDFLKQGVYILKFYSEDDSVIESKKLIVD